MSTTVECHRCGQALKPSSPISRAETCHSCQSDVRVCKNCQFFDATSYRSCRESQADWVQDQEKSNFCSYFLMQTNRRQRADSAKNNLAKLNDLFEKNTEADDADQLSNGSGVEQQIKDFLNRKKQ